MLWAVTVAALIASFGDPGAGGALRRGRGQAIAPRGRLLLQDVPRGVRPPGRPRAQGDLGDRPRRRPDGREVRPPRVRGPGRHRAGRAALSTRRSLAIPTCSTMAFAPTSVRTCFESANFLEPRHGEVRHRWPRSAGEQARRTGGPVKGKRRKEGTALTL